MLERIVNRLSPMTYTQPVLPLLLLFSLAMHLMSARSRRRYLLSILASLALFLWAWPPVAWLLTGSLEWRYRPGVSGREPEAIVVLSGYVEGNEPGLGSRLGRDSAVRCGYASWLHRRKWSRTPIIVTGDDRVTSLMRDQLVADGVPPELIWREGQSSSTFESALHTARLLREKSIRRIALVTEAFHMPRAEASFRKQGVEVDVAPCGFRTPSFGGNLEDWIPGSGAIRGNDEMIHEFVGMGYYWLRGYI